MYFEKRIFFCWKRNGYRKLGGKNVYRNTTFHIFKNKVKKWQKTAISSVIAGMATFIITKDMNLNSHVLEGKFADNCRSHPVCGNRTNIMIAIGPSISNAEQINQAVKTRARLSTYLGNNVLVKLPRYPNIIWNQLAAEELYTCLIADGIHIPDSFIKVLMKTIGDHAFLGSDATCFAGMPPGKYKNHIGGTIILDEKKRVSIKGTTGLLAGAVKSLVENIEHFVNSKLADLGEIWKMASLSVITMLQQNVIGGSLNTNDDWIIFHKIEDKIEVVRTIKNGLIVLEQRF